MLPAAASRGLAASRAGAGGKVYTGTPKEKRPPTAELHDAMFLPNQSERDAMRQKMKGHKGIGCEVTSLLGPSGVHWLVPAGLGLGPVHGTDTAFRPSPKSFCGTIA